MANDQRIVVIDTGYKHYDYERQLFESNGFSFDVFPGERDDLGAKKDFAQDAVGLLLRWTRVSDEFLTAFPKLQTIVRYGVGYDNIDLAATESRKIRVANVQSYANHAVSDHAMALILACSRGLFLRQGTLKEGFSKPPAPDVYELADKTLGIIGLGRIGGTLCGKVQLLFGRILAVDPYIPAGRFTELNATSCDLATALTECHVLTLHCNLTEVTRGLLNEEAFAQMSQRPILVNTARGPMIEPAALLAALERGRIHSAGLDVYPQEPPGPELTPLLTHPRVLATGHCAWYSTQSAVELQKRAAWNMLGLLTGQVVMDELTLAADA